MLRCAAASVLTVRAVPKPSTSVVSRSLATAGGPSIKKAAPKKKISPVKKVHGSVKPVIPTQKRTAGGFALFALDNLHNVETASLSSTRKTLSEINDLWEQLDGTAKAEINARATHHVTGDFAKSFSSIHSIVQKASLDAKALAIEKTKKLKKVSQPRALSAYNIFFVDNFKELKLATDKVPDVAKKVAAKWKSLNDDEKKKFFDQSAALKAKLNAGPASAPAAAAN